MLDVLLLGAAHQKQIDVSRNTGFFKLPASVTDKNLWFLKHFITYKMFCEYVTSAVAIYLLSGNSVTCVLQFEKNENCSPNTKDLCVCFNFEWILYTGM